MKNLVLLEGIELCVLFDSIQCYKAYLKKNEPEADEDIEILENLEEAIGKLLDDEIKEIKK